MLVADGNPANIKTVDDLRARPSPCRAAPSQVGELKKLNAKFAAAGKAPVTILQFPQDADAVLAVTSGKAQAQMDDQSVAAYNVKTVSNGQHLSVRQRSVGGRRLLERHRRRRHPQGRHPTRATPCRRRCSH